MATFIGLIMNSKCQQTLAIPLIIGLIFLGFGEINLYLKTIAIVLGIIQVIVFLWSIISKWDDKYQ